MKVAASIFSWLGGIITIIAEYVLYYNGYLRLLLPDIPDGSFGLLLVFIILFSIFQIFVLFWRHYATKEGKKIGCGICTLMLCSTIGGILTLCIPNRDL